MDKITYSITENIGTLSTSGVWEFQLNLVSWNGRKPVFDLRKWHTKSDCMSKGVTMKEDELRALRDIINEYLGED